MTLQLKESGFEASEMNTVNETYRSASFAFSLFLRCFGACCYNHRQHTLIEQCFFLEAHLETEKPRNSHYCIDVTVDYPQPFFLRGIVPTESEISRF